MRAPTTPPFYLPPLVSSLLQAAGTGLANPTRSMILLFLVWPWALFALGPPLVLADAMYKLKISLTPGERVPREDTFSFPSTTLPFPSKTISTTSAGATPTPLILFTDSRELVTCQSSELNWIHGGPDVRMVLGITNSGVTQDPAPSSGTHSNSTLSRRADPLPSGVVTQILAKDIDGAQENYRWDRVSVPQGWYILVAVQAGTDTFIGHSAASFFVRNGTNTSCVGGPPASLSSPTSSSAGPQLTPSQTPSKRSSIPVIIGGVVGVFGGIVLIMLILNLRRRRKTAEKREIAPDSAPRSLNPLDFPSPEEKSSHFLTLRRKARLSTKRALDPGASIQERQPNSPITDLEPIRARAEELEEEQPPPSPQPSHHDSERPLSQPLPPPSPASDPWNGLGDIHPQIRLEFEAMARRMARLEAEMAPPTYVSSTSYQHQGQ
ncbi:hypothetical protein PM082_012485 [Marasmius tenuissimus]|nr:hypothetical protein PM082_012485 [Marasmius tenuissimus]